MSHLILIDGNNYGFAGMNTPRLSAGGRDTQAVFNTIKKIRNIVLDHPESLFCVLWDGRSWRKDVYPEYKANREKTEKQEKDRSAYYDQAQAIKEGLKLLGLTQVFCLNMEADDLAAILSRKWLAASENNTVTLLTGDQDWQQLITPRTVWVDTIVTDKRVDHRNFEKVTGCMTAGQFIEKKCVLGDVGDNIIGFNGIGPKTLDTIYELYGSFVGMLNVPLFQQEIDWKEKTGKKLPKVLRELDEVEAFEKLKANMLLVDLNHPDIPEPKPIQKTREELKAEEFEIFCYRNAFLSITKDVEGFLKPFRRNKYVIS